MRNATACLIVVVALAGCTNGQLQGRYLNATLEDGAPGETIGNGDLKLDASLNVYMAGPVEGGMDGYAAIGTQDYYLTKYASSGVRLWTVLDGASGGTIADVRLEIDPSGNPYVSGHTTRGLDGQTFFAGAKHQDYLLTKYDPDGNRLWTAEDGALGGTTETHDVASDSSGNIYIAGQTNKAIDGKTLLGSVDLYVSKYDTNGNRQWTVEDGVTGVTANAQAVAVDASGNVVISGRVTSGSGTGLDGVPSFTVRDNYFIIKYDSNGNRQWTVQDGATAAAGTGINLFTVAVDSGGNVIVAGDTGVGLEGHTQAGQNDLFITKYNSAGTLQWSIQDGTASAIMAPFGLAVDPSGEIYVAGNIQHAGLDGNALIGDTDLIATKYDSNGNRLWTVEDGAPSTTVAVRGMALDPYGVLYLSGDIAPTGPAPLPTVGMDGNPLTGAQDLFQSRYSSSGVRE